MCMNLSQNRCHLATQLNYGSEFFVKSELMDKRRPGFVPAKPTWGWKEGSSVACPVGRPCTQVHKIAIRHARADRTLQSCRSRGQMAILTIRLNFVETNILSKPVNPVYSVTACTNLLTSTHRHSLLAYDPRWPTSKSHAISACLFSSCARRGGKRKASRPRCRGPRRRARRSSRFGSPWTNFRIRY